MSELLDSLKDEEGLDERERAFLDVLFDICNGDVRAAMDEVGYPKSASTSYVRRKLNKFIKQRSKDFLVSESARASLALVSVLRDPSAPGQKTLLDASKQILDRSSIQEEATTGPIQVKNMFILPPKVVENDEA